MRRMSVCIPFRMLARNIRQKTYGSIDCTEHRTEKSSVAFRIRIRDYAKVGRTQTVVECSRVCNAIPFMDWDQLCVLFVHAL